MKARRPAILRSFFLRVGPRNGPLAGSRDCATLLFETGPNLAVTASMVELDPDAADIKMEHGPVEVFVFGDDQDFVVGEYLGNGVTVTVDRGAKSVCIRSSLTGLPPVYRYADGTSTIFASSIDAIASVRETEMDFDTQGLVEMATIGYPIQHRTLFRHVDVLPAGTELSLSPFDGIAPARKWETKNTKEFGSLAEYHQAQKAAMAAALNRMELGSTFLSLTAGLDTRAILALLVSNGRGVPAFTLSGTSQSLDARRASELCQAYGLKHDTISINNDLIRYLPEYSVEASRRSGGLASVSQALEIALYRSLSGAFGCRLSGNLGNQIGRSGTEGVGGDGNLPPIFTQEFMARAGALQESHWLSASLGDGPEVRPLFLIQRESLFASLANYAIGTTFALQQTPYADRSLIEYKLREPRSALSNKNCAIRLRDLHHRFFGDPREASFQRQIVAEIGGPVASIPINWGWRPAGRPRLHDYCLGLGALADLVLNQYVRSPAISPLKSLMGRVSGLYGFQSVDLLELKPLADFVQDTLRKDEVYSNGIMDKQAVLNVLNDRRRYPGARQLLTCAMNIALAHHVFLAGSGSPQGAN
jgi:hypothetical protein